MQLFDAIMFKEIITIDNHSFHKLNYSVHCTKLNELIKYNKYR